MAKLTSNEQKLTIGLVAAVIVAGTMTVLWNNTTNLAKAVKKANPNAILTGLTEAQLKLWNSYKVS